MTTVIINPGSGPVGDATEENAIANMNAFVADLEEPAATITRDPARDARGRFAFVVNARGEEHTVDMPGIPLEQVRYASLLTAPRLYVDGSSWWWKFALNVFWNEDDE